MLGYRPRSYRGNGFIVRLRPGPREAIRVLYEREGTKVELQGQRTGEKWKGIWVWFPNGIESSDRWRIASDLEAALREMKYEQVTIGEFGTKQI